MTNDDVKSLQPGRTFNACRIYLAATSSVARRVRPILSSQPFPYEMFLFCCLRSVVMNKILFLLFSFLLFFLFVFFFFLQKLTDVCLVDTLQSNWYALHWLISVFDTHKTVITSAIFHCYFRWVLNFQFGVAMFESLQRLERVMLNLHLSKWIFTLNPYHSYKPLHSLSRSLVHDATTVALVWSTRATSPAAATRRRPARQTSPLAGSLKFAKYKRRRRRKKEITKKFGVW